MDPLRGHAARADRGARRAPAGGSRSDSAGDEAEPGVLQDRSTPICSTRRRPRRTCRRRSTPSTPTWRSALHELFGAVIDYLRDVGEARSATEIEDHFKRNFGMAGVTGVCEYLADQGLIGKVSTARAAHQEEATSTCRSWRFSTAGNRNPMPGTAAAAKRRRAAHHHRGAGRARHNLKNISVEIPRDKLIVVTGLSGRASRAWRSTPSTPKGSGATWNRCPAYAKRFVVAGGQARRRFRLRPLAGDLHRAEDHRQQSRAPPSAR